MNSLLNVNWFDVAVILTLLIGFALGRRAGMSKEWVNLVQWLVILGVGAVAYAPLGNLIADLSKFKPWVGHIIAYAFVVLFVKLIVNVVKRRFAEKIENSSHMFGKGEFYLGMFSGMLRCLVILLVFLAMLHPVATVKGGTTAGAKFQQENFGSVFFPTLGTLRQDVFEASVTGKWIEENLEFLLIEKPAPPKAAKR
jgi:uncharacterized membrane protein required for colicin V production